MPGEEANTTDGVLTTWHVAVNAPFRAHDTIATVETAKAAIDIEAEADGKLLATLVDEGEEVDVGAPLALLGAPGEQIDNLEAALAGLQAAAASAEMQPSRTDRKDGLSLEVPEADLQPAPAAPPITPATGQPNGAAAPTAAALERVFTSPLARRLARDAGLRPDEIVGTGPNARIVRRDVENAIARRGHQPPPSNRHQAAAPTAGAPDPGVTDIPHSRLRRLIAARLVESTQTAPHFYLRGRARVDALVQVRAELNDSAPVRISLNDLLVKAVGQAHLRVPAMNVIWTPNALRSYSTVDVAVAVNTGAGLVTPVVRHVDTTGIIAIAQTTKDLSQRARDGTLQQRELEGGTITISNLGMYGTEEFAAIINPPHAAILAVGAVGNEPVAEDDCSVGVAAVLRLTLSVDHRAVDGAVAAEWMQALIRILEKPVQILA